MDRAGSQIRPKSELAKDIEEIKMDRKVDGGVKERESEY